MYVLPVLVCHLLYIVVKMMMNCLGEENTGSKFHPFFQDTLCSISLVQTAYFQ